MIIKTITFISFFISCISYANSVQLIVGYGDHNGAPYAIEAGEHLQEGIIKDLVTEISAELDIDIRFQKTPRKRIERYLESDTIHLVLLTNPKWLSNSDKLQWSKPLFTERDQLVVKADNPNSYHSFKDLKHMTIGTIRGYHYPNLQPYFDKNYFARYSVDVNFIRLELNRIDALVDSETLINYHLQQASNAKDFKVLPFHVSKHKIYAALSPNAPVKLADFNQALTKLHEQGVIAAILKKYRVNE